MRDLRVLRRSATILLAVIPLVRPAAPARADVFLKCTTGRHQMSAITRVPGPSVNDVVDGTNDGVITWGGRDEGGNPDSTCFLVSDQTPDFSHRIYASACCGPGSYESMSVYAIGDGSSAGGLRTSAFPVETAFAGVGIYPSTPLVLKVDRTVTPGALPDVVTLTFVDGGLQTRSNGSSATMKIVVYPDLAAAKADPALSGAGSAFFGAVTLTGDTGSLLPVSGLTLSDFSLLNDGTGGITATLVQGTKKIVSVPDAKAAIVALYGDPKAGTNQTITAVGGELPEGVSLAPVKPNPFGGSVAFQFSLPHPGPVSLEVFDALGRRIRSWRWEGLPAGEHTVKWDGRTVAGSRAQAGALLVRLSALGKTYTRKAMFLP